MLKTILGLGLIVACVYAEETKYKVATVDLKSADGSDKITGKVTFTESADGVKITGEIQGISAGQHGFHVHENGATGNKCADAGGHFNPEKKDHGAPGDENRHVGDLGNIVADDKNVAKIDFTDKIISLSGNHSILDKAIVLHADPDDLGKGGESDSLTTGHAGARLACGVIKENK